VAILRRPLAKGRNEAEFVERRWAQGVDRAPDVGDGSPYALGQVGEQALGLWVAGEAVACGFELECEGGQLRTDAVVQVAPEAPSLLLAAGHQPFAGSLQVSCETHGVGGDPYLAGEVLE
jgi:hypothetical protein